MPSRRVLRTSAVALLALTAAVVSCSGDEADDSTSSTAPLSSRPTTTEPAPNASTTVATTTPVTIPLAEVTVRLTKVAVLDGPTALVPRAGTDDLFGAERAGTVRRLTPADGDLVVDDAPVLDITDAVADLEGERGLLGLAFSPDGSQLFVSYTDGNDDGASVIARYDMDGDVADPSTRFEILRLAQPFSNHNGGNIVFGPDDYLYIGFGDGGSQGDPSDNGQDLGTLLAKMLRIDVLTDVGDSAYSVPADNPFVDTPDARREIWSYGLRNPWRFSFDRQTGDLWIGDVGGAEWEEVDYLPAPGGTGRGANLGWSLREGAHNTDKDGDRPADALDPIFEYSHDEGSSITGGFVYRGAAVAQLSGVYLFSDFSAATLRGLTVVDGRLDQQAVIATTGAPLSQVSSFGQDNKGELYVLGLAGEVWSIGPA